MKSRNGNLFVAVTFVGALLTPAWLPAQQENANTPARPLPHH